ncbi:hypothetical protein HYT52_03335 [Candidatus Woesearchaeota archaeon]|nr:hypothetical protein [Candidatus Woesearchaeota archaeon]
MLTEDQKRLIDGNNVFVCQYSTGFFDSPSYEEGLAYAQSLGKPIYRLMENGFPERGETFLGLSIRHTEHFDGPVGSASYVGALDKLLDKITSDLEEGRLEIKVPTRVTFQ